LIVPIQVCNNGTVAEEWENHKRINSFPKFPLRALHYLSSFPAPLTGTKAVT
jgi:hypothetical protein